MNPGEAHDFGEAVLEAEEGGMDEDEVLKVLKAGLGSRNA